MIVCEGCHDFDDTFVSLFICVSIMNESV